MFELQSARDRYKVVLLRERRSHSASILELEQTKMHTHYLLLLSTFALGACELNARTGDGLMTSDLAPGHQFGTVTPSGADMLGEPDIPLLSCKNPALFVHYVLPRFIERCVECHDGTKLKASISFYLGDAMSAEPAKQKNICDLTLTVGVNADRLQSAILAEVDPARADLEHEFKFESSATFGMYRDAVMAWLVAE